MRRDHIVSIRLTDEEQSRLRRIADAAGATVSDLVRGYVRETMAPPLPLGLSAGTSTTHVWVTPEFRQAIGMSATVVLWADGTVGPQYPALVTA